MSEHCAAPGPSMETEGFRAGVARVWRLWAPSRPPASDARAGTQLQPEDTLHGQAHTGSSTAGCPVERPASSVPKGTAPPDPACRPVVSSEVPAWGAPSATMNPYSARGGPQDTVEVPDGRPQRWAAGGTCREQRPWGQRPPPPCGGLGPARRGCPLLSGHRQRPSGPASEAALGRAPPLRAQKLGGGGSLLLPRAACLHVAQLRVFPYAAHKSFGVSSVSLLVLYLFISSRVFHEQKFLI